MLMRVSAHGGCMGTVSESALKIYSGRKIPCCTGDSNCVSIAPGFSVGHSTNWAIHAPNVLLGSFKTERKINNSFLSVCLFFIWRKEKPQALVNLTDLYCKFLCSAVKYSCAIRYTGSTANRGSLQLWCDSNFAKHFDNIVQPFHNCLNYYIQCIAGSGMKITLWPGHWAGYLKRKNIIVWLDTFHVIVSFM